MSSYRVEEILRDVQDGRISDYEAKSELERELGSCSCMRDNIERAVRDVEHFHHDSWSVRSRLEDEQQSCEREE